MKCFQKLECCSKMKNYNAFNCVVCVLMCICFRPHISFNKATYPVVSFPSRHSVTPGTKVRKNGAVWKWNDDSKRKKPTNKQKKKDENCHPNDVSLSR